MCPLRLVVLGALLFAPACATAPASKPESTPRTAAPRGLETKAAPAERQGPEIVPAQVFVGAGPIAVPPQIMVAPRPIVVPVPGSLPGPVPLVVLPDDQRELLERGELPRSGSKPVEEREKPEAKPDGHQPTEGAPPGLRTPAPRVDPAPIVVKPEPEEASRKSKTDKPAPNKKPTPVPMEAPRLQKKAWDPAPDTVPENWDYPPGKRPCDVIGTGGSGLSRGGRMDKIRCEYNCGGLKRTDWFIGNSAKVCIDPFRRPTY